MSDAREAIEGQHGLFDADVLGDAAHRAEVGEPLAEDDARGQLRHGHPGGLAHERHRARAARIHLEDVQLVVLVGELHVDETPHAETKGEQLRLLAHLLERTLPERDRGDDAGGVAGVHAGLLDVLHHGADVDILAVGDGVHVHLDGILEEACR